MLPSLLPPCVPGDTPRPCIHTLSLGRFQHVSAACPTRFLLAPGSKRSRLDFHIKEKEVGIAASIYLERHLKRRASLLPATGPKVKKQLLGKQPNIAEPPASVQDYLDTGVLSDQELGVAPPSSEEEDIHEREMLLDLDEEDNDQVEELHAPHLGLAAQQGAEEDASSACEDADPDSD